MFENLSLWLYSNDLRDFINNDLKIIKSEKYYHFVSKREKYTFVKYSYSEPMHDCLLFQIADSIFYHLMLLKGNENI